MKPHIKKSEHGWMASNGELNAFGGSAKSAYVALISLTSQFHMRKCLANLFGK